ncbi:MarR family winged helix-turn-helix transcriptional regulator [Kineosporia babensis]|nr:MarR family transcriptional regulator [Kineosporia babensis]
MLLARHSLSSYARKHQLDRSAYILLSLLRIKGAMSIGELSDVLGLDASTLNRQTAAAMRAGLMDRIPDPDGGIARKFVLTEAGAEALDAQRDQILISLDKVMADWPDEDIATFAQFLQRFNTDIERLAGRVWPRPD